MISARMKDRKPIPEDIIRKAYDDYFTRDVSWRKLEAKYGVLHGTLYAAFKRLGLRLRG